MSDEKRRGPGGGDSPSWEVYCVDGPGPAVLSLRIPEGRLYLVGDQVVVVLGAAHLALGSFMGGLGRVLPTLPDTLRNLGTGPYNPHNRPNREERDDDDT